MSLRIYNSLTKKKEEFVPWEGKTVSMYACGVTVYDQCHIGHARSLYVFDVIRRYLKLRGFQVHFVRNITDIDDKIIKRANELKIPWQQLAEKNIASYYEDLNRLHIDKADIEPRATENISEMIRHIEGLIRWGFAYVVEGDVYFSVYTFGEYGKLSGQSAEKMLEAVRIEKNEKKKDPLDFALWKKSKDDEPAWDSPWGKGRPGWHIECSAMSIKHLGRASIDIHAGGRDLIFPHHENELAQAECFTLKPFAKYWIHHGLLTINGQKMAKSLGNFITVSDLLLKFNADDLKMFFLFSHYASPVDYSDEKMEEAHKALDRIDVLFWKASEIVQKKAAKEIVKPAFLEKAQNSFLEAMDDDFNTPKALSAIFDLVNDTNKFIDHNTSDDHYADIIRAAVDTIESYTTGIFGLFAEDMPTELAQEEQELLKEREEARKDKDFKKSDEIRNLLRERGIVVEDTKDGQVWRWI